VVRVAGSGDPLASIGLNGRVSQSVQVAISSVHSWTPKFEPWACWWVWFPISCPATTAPFQDRFTKVGL
jgi:hypothetical protein